MRTSLLLATLLLPTTVFAEAAYERSIETSHITEAKPVFVVVPESVTLYNDLSSLRITENGTVAPSKSANKAQGTFLGIIENVSFCSLEQGNRAQAVYDGDSRTTARPDPFRNPSNCTITVQFQSPVRTDSVSLVTTGLMQKLTVSAKNQAGGMATLRSVEKARSTTFSSVITDTIKIALEYETVPTIEEISIGGEVPARILFEAKPGMQYKLVYGDTNPPKIPITPVTLFSNAKTSFVSVGPETIITGDSDGDGIIAAEDNCPLVPNPDQKDTDSDGLGDSCDNAPHAANAPQNDMDHDGVGDSQDNCRNVFNPDQRDDDLDGIGYACDDADGDGVTNSKDNCPWNANRDQADIDGNGTGDICENDRDGDGLIDEHDNCRYHNNPNQEDRDLDGIGDSCDSCPEVKNPQQEDVNENGIGDACEAEIQDPDGDGMNNEDDNCASIANPDQKDTDNDGKGDVCDNCPTLQNPNQRDKDENGQGDVCTDEDGDGLLAHIDNCPRVENADQSDRDNDGIGDACEDDDGDGVQNYKDNCKHKYNRDQKDSDADGAGDACDEDDNRLSEEHPWVLWIGLTAIVLVMVGLCVRLIVQMKNDQNKPDGVV